MNVLTIAKVAHEVNRAFCQSVGDYSQPKWDEAPDWQVTSACNGVEFHMNNETTPRDSHENWMSMKRADGWVYGPVKDALAKTHPCMVPYHDLSTEQKSKDYIFKAVVESLAPLTEY